VELRLPSKPKEVKNRYHFVRFTRTSVETVQSFFRLLHRLTSQTLHSHYGTCVNSQTNAVGSVAAVLLSAGVRAFRSDSSSSQNTPLFRCDGSVCVIPPFSVIPTFTVIPLSSVIFLFDRHNSDSDVRYRDVPATVF